MNDFSTKNRIRQGVGGLVIVLEPRRESNVYRKKKKRKYLPNNTHVEIEASPMEGKKKEKKKKSQLAGRYPQRSLRHSRPLTTRRTQEVGEKKGK